MVDVGRGFAGGDSEAFFGDGVVTIAIAGSEAFQDSGLIGGEIENESVGGI